jgi:hypothetical protein
MIEILHFRKGATFIKLNMAETIVDVRRNLMSYCGWDKNTENTQLTG